MLGRQRNSLDSLPTLIKDGRKRDGTRAKPLTIKEWRTTETYLNEFFGVRMIEDISVADADRFRIWLATYQTKDKQIKTRNTHLMWYSPTITTAQPLSAGRESLKRQM